MSVKYTVSIRTSNAPFAGTDSKIHFRLSGGNNWSCDDLEAYVRPYVGRDPFEMNQTDTFEIEVEGRGFDCVAFVEIALISSFSGSWFIEDITITGISSATNKNTKWVAYLNTYVPDDHKIHQYMFREYREFEDVQ